MGKLIYFIGGASASGKSTVTKKLSDISGHRTIKLDNFYDLLRAAMNDEQSSEEVTRKITINIVEQFLTFETICVMEGVWILPAEAKELINHYGEQFYPVFCGYPNANVSERLKLIKSGKIHWLCETSQEDRNIWIQEQLEESRWYQDECAKYQIPFFDFSNVEEGSAALIANYREWCGMEQYKQMNSLLKNSVENNHKFDLTRVQHFLSRLTKRYLHS